MESLAIRTDRLTKRFGPEVAVDDLDLTVPRGSVVGYLGPNGAGKTTTIKMLAGLWRPTSGSAEVMGFDVARDRDRVQRLVGYLPGDFTGYPGMTGRQLLTLLGRLRGGVDAGWLADLAERFHADLDRRLSTLSHGNRQKIGIIQAFLHRPPLLVLDEPTAGLDPLMQREFLDLVREVRADGATVLLSSHVLSEVAAVADIVALIDQGRLRLEQPIDTFLAGTRRRLDLTFADEVPVAALRAAAGVCSLDVTGRTAHLRVAGSTASLLSAAAPFGVVDVVGHEPDLTEAFLDLYRGAEVHDEPLRESVVGAAS